MTRGWPAWPETDSRSFTALGAAFEDTPGVDEVGLEAGARTMAELAGRAHCVLTADLAASALVALRLSQVGPGDRVALPATCAREIVDTVARTGATPVFFDASPHSLAGIDRMPDAAPKAVFATHRYAQRCDIAALRAAFPQTRIIEDASHLGANLGPDAGEITLVDLSAPNVLTAGSGAAVLTDDPVSAAEAAAQARAYPASAMSAALLLDQLDRLPGHAIRRARAAFRLLARLAGSPWQAVYDEEVLRSGRFSGLVLRPPHGRGPHERIIAEVRRACGLDLGLIPALPPEGRGAPIGTFKEHSLEAVLSRGPLAARWWRYSHVIVPHHAFLAADELVDALADALLGRPGGAPSGTGPTPARAFSPRTTIDVLMITRGRRATLGEALASIAAQDVDADVRVTLFVDSPTGTVDVPEHDLADLRVLTPAPDAELPEAPWDRIAELRELAVRSCTADYTAFIDDDNLWAPDHLSSLMRLAAGGVPAVHSWRQLIMPDGTPAQPLRFPWLPHSAEADEVWQQMVVSGSMTPGESTVREGVEIGMVDMGEWLFATWLLRLLRFFKPRTPSQLDDRMGEDDILLNQLCRFGVPLACTERASLRYRLGGMSNPETPRPAELEAAR